MFLWKDDLKGTKIVGLGQFDNILKDQWPSPRQVRIQLQRSPSQIQDNQKKVLSITALSFSAHVSKFCSHGKVE